MALKFSPLNMPIWGCVDGGWTFVISKLGDEDGVYRASVGRSGDNPFDNSRTDLGQWKTFAEAEKVCNDYYQKRNN